MFIRIASGLSVDQQAKACAWNRIGLSKPCAWNRETMCLNPRNHVLGTESVSQCEASLSHQSATGTADILYILFVTLLNRALTCGKREYNGAVC